MGKPGRLPLIAYGLAVLIIVADQISKYWILNGVELPLRGTVEVWPPVFSLTFVPNRGVSFGLFRSPEGQETIRWLLAAFSVAVAVALIVWVRKARRAWSAVSVGLIIGGAVGNVIDRIRLGWVVDFLDFSGVKIMGHGFRWIFNVADSAITVGVILLLLETFLTAEKDKTPL